MYYKKEIDGLRFIAVLCVILYHLDLFYDNFQVFKGGFLGVDVFFVISGFLITRQIHIAQIDGSFSLLEFFNRRVRRIAPAFISTLIITLLLGSLLLAPEDFESLSKETFFAALGISNFYYLSQTGYFEPSAKYQYLLHTWSLTVEEQFYFLLPTLLWLTNYKLAIKTPVVLLCVALLSALLNLLNFQDENLGFYMTHARMWEFLSGGLLAVAGIKCNHLSFDKRFLSSLGLSILFFSFLLISNQSGSPFINAIPAVIGTVCIIYASDTDSLVNKMLANRVMRLGGKISFSLYLIHWPLLCFLSYFGLQTQSINFLAFYLSCTIGIAWLLYRYIETPFRHSKKQRPRSSDLKHILAIFSCLALLVATSSYIAKHDGLPSRVSEEKLEQVNIHQTSIQPFISKNPFYVGLDKWSSRAEVGARSANHVLIIGDSHAKHLIGMAQYLVENYDVSFEIHSFVGCQPVFGVQKIYKYPRDRYRPNAKAKGCRKQLELWKEFIFKNRNLYNYVALAGRWSSVTDHTRYSGGSKFGQILVDPENPLYDLENSKRVFAIGLAKTVETLTALNIKVILVEQVPEQKRKQSGCYNLPKWLAKDALIESRCLIETEKALNKHKFTSSILSKLSTDIGVLHLPSLGVFCFRHERFCKSVHDKSLLFKDDNHLSQFGSVYLAKKWSSMKSFPFEKRILK